MRTKRGSLSELALREEKLAYWLLLPTFLILLTIAIYPLGSVFYNSLTNKEFASNEPTSFVGWDNFANLLSMKIVELPPVLDEVTGEPQVNPETGETIYQSSIKTLPREPKWYKPLSKFNFFGKRFAIGATDSDFILSIKDTLSFTIISVVIETTLGLGIALVVNSNFPGRGAMRAVMLVPWAIPTAISSVIWAGMLGSTRTGFFNVVFQSLGLSDGQTPFLIESAFQLPAMVAIDVWKTTPFMALLLLAGLQLIPKDMYEAADVDGASKVRQFLSITLPMLRPTLAVALVFRTLDAIRVFDLFQIILAQKKYSMASFAYYQLIDNQMMGYSSASSVIIFAMIFIFAFIYIRMLGVDKE